MDNHQMQIILESIDNKFQLVLEGHSSLANQIDGLRQDMDERFDLVDCKLQAVNDRIDAVEQKLTRKIDAVAADLKATDERLSKKIDAVAADLKDHRADTEAHGGKGLYVVREG